MRWQKCEACGFRWDPDSLGEIGGDQCRECESVRHWNTIVQLEHDVEVAKDEAREFLGEGNTPAGLKYVVQVLVARLRKDERS